MNIDPNSPAFASAGLPIWRDGQPVAPWCGEGWTQEPQIGMTIRADIAKHLMAGLLANPARIANDDGFAQDAIDLADALIIKLNATGKDKQ